MSRGFTFPWAFDGVSIGVSMFLTTFVDITLEVDEFIGSRGLFANGTSISLEGMGECGVCSELGLLLRLTPTTAVD